VKAGMTIVLVVLAAGLLAAPAVASMSLDLNQTSTSSSSVNIAIDSPTYALNGMNLNARIISASTPLTLLKFYSSVVSTNVGGGLIEGNLTDDWNSADLKLYGSATIGTQQNLDGVGDPDLDIGSTVFATSTDYMLAQKGSTTYVTQTDATHGIPAYTVNFAGTGWVAANPHGITVLQAIARQKLGVSIWKEGTTSMGSTTLPDTGYTVTLYRADVAKVNGMTSGAELDLHLGGSGTMDAVDSIGSLDQYQWDVNGDGTYEALTATGHMMTFTVHESGLVDWNDGAGDSGSYMPTPAQKAAEKVLVGLRTKNGDNGSPLTAGTATATLLLPEPATMALLGLGGLALAIRRRRAA